jgi:RNA polymerase sigma-B factor
VGASESIPDEGLRQRLVATHLPLVRSIARRHLGRGEELDDLVQIGAVGLVKASTRFDTSRGVSFAKFAAPAIDGEIRNHLRDRTPAVRMPRGERTLTAQRARAAVSVLAQDSAVAAETEEGTSCDDRLVLASSVRSLDERERRIVFLRFHADMTERQIAHELEISQAHVSRLLTGALTKLREDLRNAGVDLKDGDITLDSDDFKGSEAKGSEAGESENREVSPPEAETGDSKSSHSYSGRFLVRMPASLHEQLARTAQEEQISLNRLVTNILAGAVTPTEARKGEQPSLLREVPAAPGRLARRRTIVTGAKSGRSTRRPVAQPQITARSYRLALATNLIVVVLAGIVAVLLLVVALSRL